MTPIKKTLRTPVGHPELSRSSAGWGFSMGDETMLDTIVNAVCEENRRSEAAARTTCDYCGEEAFRGYGVSLGGLSYGRQRTLVRVGGEWFAACTDRCAQDLVRRHEGRAT